MNYPDGGQTPSTQVTMEIGPFPNEENTCTKWKNSYFQNGTTVAVKDYKLCRGKNATDLYYDEGNGVKLACQLLDNVLVAPFKYEKLILVSQVRLIGDILQEEILTIDDQYSTERILPLNARVIQRLSVKRVC